MSETLFHKGLIPALLEIYNKEDYRNDMELFMKFLELIKVLIRSNKPFHENIESRERDFTFICSQCSEFISQVIFIYILVTYL